jgi:hypothetical protein
MDRNQLVASLVGSLAWPIGAVVLAFILRPFLSELVKRLRSVKYGGIEADLHALDELSVEDGKRADKSLPSASIRDDSSLALLIETAPAATMEKAWRRVRDEIMRAAYTQTNEQRLSITEALETLLRSGSLTTRDLFIFNALESIRQGTYYEGAEVSPAAALNFISQAEELAEKARQAADPPAPDY